MTGETIFGNVSLFLLILADLVVCGLILVYLFRDRRHKGKPVDTDELKSLIESLSGLIKESDRASRELLDALNQRHRKTAELLEEVEAKEGELKKVVRNTEQILSKTGDAEVVDPYAEVSRLADLGMRVEEIAKRVNLPKGEIELVLGLKR